MATKESVGSNSRRLRLKSMILEELVSLTFFLLRESWSECGSIGGGRVCWLLYSSAEGGRLILLLTYQAEVQQVVEEGKREELGEAQSRNT